MNNLQKLQELKDGLFGHCKSSYLKDDEKLLNDTLKTYDEMFKDIENAIALSEKLIQIAGLSVSLLIDIILATREGIYIKGRIGKVIVSYSDIDSYWDEDKEKFVYGWKIYDKDDPRKSIIYDFIDYGTEWWL